MAEDIAAEYRRRWAMYEALYGLRLRRYRSLLAYLVLEGLAVAWAVLLWKTHGIASGWILLPVVAAVATLVGVFRIKRSALQSAQLAVWYERASARIDGREPQSGLTGEVFLSEDHLFGRDLEVVGPNSLFGLLATVRTALGQEALAAALLDAADAETARKRQVAVKELASGLEIRERLEGLGTSRFDDAQSEDFEAWLAPSDNEFPSWVPAVLGMLTIGWITAFGLSWLLPGFAVDIRTVALSLLAGQVILCGWLRDRVRKELTQNRRLIDQVRVLRAGLELIREEQFDAPLLREIQSRAMQGTGALDELYLVLNLLEQRGKDWFYTLSLLLGAGTQLAYRLRIWRSRHVIALNKTLETWSEFDMLVALATYAREHPRNAWPEIVDGETLLSAKGMWHPLLPVDQAVTNDVELGESIGFLVISGSNMAGKSTLLRALGCNVLLALAGAPVCASSMRVTPLRTGASLAVTDSLAEGRSKFLAETERLRDIVALARSNDGRVLFLIDEILSGTNSEDRRSAAEAVVRALRQVGAIGALSTHDLTLTKMAEDDALMGLNVHMCSVNVDDPLAFDYRLKAGINRMTNGMAIVRMLRLTE